MPERFAAELKRRRVRVVVTGSLARADRMRFAIESVVEDGLDGMPSDFIYQDMILARKLRRFMEGAVCASELH